MGIDSVGFWSRLQDAFEGARAPEIARLIGRSKQSVYRWRDGELPGLDILVEIAESRGVSLHWLVIGKGPRTANQVGGVKPEVAELSEDYEEEDQESLKQETPLDPKVLGEAVADDMARMFEQLADDWRTRKRTLETVRRSK